jgi:hypothetical protein
MTNDIEPGLAENEAIIERGLASFMEVGQALARIRNGRQYRAAHATFEAYCRERWQFNDSRARQLMAAAETVTNVTVDGVPAPSSEGVARELKGTPGQKAEVWRETVKRHGPKPTAAQVREVAREKVPHAQRPRPRQRNEEGDDLWKDERVLAWVLKAKKAGRGQRDRLMEDSKAGKYGWPVEGKYLGQNAADRARAVVDDRERHRRGASPKEPEGEQRVRDARRTRRQTKAARNAALVDILHLQENLGKIVQMLETTDFHAEYDLDELAVDALTALTDNLLATIDWCERALPLVKGRMGKVAVLELIRKLENTNGRDDFEADQFKARAKRLRREHGLLGA